MNQNNKILVLGLGNEVLGDESLGLKIVDDLRQSSPSRELEYAKANNGGLEILEYIKDFKTLIIIDTTISESGCPGKIRFFTPGNYRETLHLSSEHDVNFLTALKTGQILGFKIPVNIHIIAIEIIRDPWICEKLSDYILEKYDEILSEIVTFIKTSIFAVPVRTENISKHT